MNTKLGRPSDEKDLWHGTRTTDSKCITDSDEGFDIRFSRDGMQGVGNYFALKAEYSAKTNFVHNETDGTKGLFMARVLVGNPGDRVDANRKMPPWNRNKLSERYDSVYASSSMYVVYDNYKAYPLYYVKFKGQNF